MLFKKIPALFSTDLAIDLGTSSILVYEGTRGIVACEPSVVAVVQEERREHRIVAVGNDAKDMIGRAHPRVSTVRPVRAGVISDFELTEVLLRHFILQVRRRSSFVGPRIVVCIPTRATDVERRAIRDSVFSAGAREVHLIEAPLAAAIGAGLHINEPTGHMVLDIGGGIAAAAVISMSSIACSHCIQGAGDELNEDILRYVRQKYDLLIGENMAEEIKTQLASAWHTDESQTMEVKGRDLVAGLPGRIVLNCEEVWEAIKETVVQIVEAVKATLEKTPQELGVGVMKCGITLTGGGALLKGLDTLLHHETGLPVHMAPDPVACVVRGAGMALKATSLLERVACQN